LPLALFFQDIRSKKGIKAKFLMDQSAKKIAEKFKKYPSVDIKFMPDGILTPVIFTIYDNKVIINIAKEKKFFVIHNKRTAEVFDIHFNMLWGKKR
jgi:rRNA maturation protein Rpf1